MGNKYVTGIVVLITTMSILSGCAALSPSLITEENISQLDKKNAYVIVGQKLVKDKTIKNQNTNLTHMSMALHINWDLPQSTLPASIFTNGPFFEFLLADSDSHTYRTWVLPGKMINSESRAIVFANMVASKDGFFIPFHSSLRPFNTGIAPLEKGRNTRALETFKGNAFIIDKPGVYYLGEMELTGILEMAGGLGFDKERGGLLSWNVETKAHKGQLEKYLFQKGLTDMPIHDLSNSWRELPMDKLYEYKAGEKDLPFQRLK